MAENNARSVFCPGCPYLAPVATAKKLWLRAVHGGGCAHIASQRPYILSEAPLEGESAVSSLATKLSAGERRNELVLLCPARELNKAVLDTLRAVNAIVLAIETEEIEPLCVDAGVAYYSCSAFDLKDIESKLREALSASEAAVVRCFGECAMVSGKGERRFAVKGDYCRRCGACSRLGCAAISAERVPKIDPSLCAGCGVCAQICPVNAIKEL